MIEKGRLVAGAVIVALALVACGRSSRSTGPTMAGIAAGSVQLSDIKANLDDAANWWPGPPTFGARPLDISERDDNDRLYLIERFSHIGSSEQLTIKYQVWSSTSLAQAIVTSTQQAVSGSQTSPRAGDQVLYYHQNLGFGAAPYMSRALVRVGQTVAEVSLTQASSFAPSSAMGKVANTVGAKLKASLSSARLPSPSPSPGATLLAPVGPDIMLLGSETLPVEVVAQMVDDPAPADMRTMFGSLGVTDFAYGDYVLLADTHMEVQTAGFTFSSSTGATDWLDGFIGKSNLDQNGDYLNFDNVTDQYIGAVGVGSHGALMICRSVADFEAASRACETPMGRVLAAWKNELLAA